MTKKEMQEIIEDIIQAYKKYPINLKFLRSTVQYDDIGALYEINDTIVPDVHLILYGKHPGVCQGPNMEDEQPTLENITRLTLSRLLPQC